MAKTTFTITEAKAQLSKLIKLAKEGSEITIGGSGMPEVILIKYEAPKAKRTPGTLKNKIWISEDFNAFDPEIEQLFYGEK